MRCSIEKWNGELSTIKTYIFTLREVYAADHDFVPASTFWMDIFYSIP